MRYLLICLLFLSLSGCCLSGRRMPPPVVTRDVYTDSITRLVVEYSVELKHDKHLRLENARVLYGDDPGIVLVFTTQDIMEVREARALLVDLVEGLLERINSENSLFEEGFSHYYQINELDININFQSFYARYADPNYIGSVLLQDGTAFYYAASVKDDKLAFWNNRIEPYFKSKSILMAEREGEAIYQAAHPKPVSAVESWMSTPAVGY